MFTETSADINDEAAVDTTAFNPDLSSNLRFVFSVIPIDSGIKKIGS